MKCFKAQLFRSVGINKSLSQQHVEILEIMFSMDVEGHSKHAILLTLYGLIWAVKVTSFEFLRL